MPFKTFGRVIAGKNLMDACPICEIKQEQYDWCTGQLYPVLKRHEMSNEVLGPGGYHRTWETIEYLACGECGAMFQAKLAGTDVEKHLLEQLKTIPLSTEEVPTHCPQHGGSEGLLEFTHFIRDPSRLMRGYTPYGITYKILYCPGCLTVAHVTQNEKKPPPDPSLGSIG